MIMRRFGMAVGVAAIALCATSSNPGAAAEIHGGIHPMPAVILQVVKAFDNPEAAIFSADGNHVYVSNAAEAGDLSEGFG